MLQFDNILDAIQGLSYEEKLKLRLLLNEELQVPAASNGNKMKPAKRIIGLFADEPELMDRVMEAVYEQRLRPLRLHP
jgi:hypothetical protein